MPILVCPRPDFLVINVIDEEKEATEEIFKEMEFNSKDCRAVTREESHYHLHTKTIKNNGKSKFLTVAHVRLSSHTNAAAAAILPKILEDLRPVFVIVTGIAGGVKGKVKVGDIVVPTSIRYSEYMRVEKEMEEELEALAIEVPVRQLRDIIGEIKGKEEWRERLKKESGYSKKEESFEVHDEKCVIESFEKLIGDWAPMKNLYGEIGRQTLAIDMESAGIGLTLSENKYEGYHGYLVIRGISDIIGVPFKNDDLRQEWKRSASKAAAAMALEMIVEHGGKLIGEDEKNDWRSRIEERVSRSLKVMMSTYPCVEWLPICLKSGSSEEKLETDPDFSPERRERQLATRVGEYLEKKVSPAKTTLISGPAGSSKSLVLNLFSKYLLEKGQYPLVVDFPEMAKKLKPTDQTIDLTKYPVSEFANDLVSVTSVHSVGIMERISELNGEVYLMIDGLNEITGGEMGERTVEILKLIERLKETLGIAGLKVIATHRTTVGGDRVNHVEVSDIPKDEAQRLYDEIFGQDAFKNLPDDHKKLLQRPFFLYRCLSEKINMKDEAELVEKFLDLSFHPKENGIDMEKLAKYTFESYRDTGTWHYETGPLKRVIGGPAYNALEKSGNFLRSEDGKSCWFQHQLYTDYLVGKHISTLARWSPEVLDVTTLQSGSYEPVDIAVQILERNGDKGRIESAIKEVYDWSWSHAMTVVGSVHKDPYFKELAFAISAIILEKLGDPMPHTRDRTKERVDSRKDIVPKRLIETGGKVEELVKVIDGEPDGTPWFLHWKSLYSSPADVLVHEILSSDSVIGWTATNVFRRKSPSRKTTLKLIAEFEKRKNDDNSKSVRWRIIHALGKTKEKEGLEILEVGFSSDSYEWVRYGAARCLIENAAVLPDNRDDILKFLDSNISPGHKAVNEEIDRSLFYNGKDKDDEGWADFISEVRTILRERDSKNIESYEEIEEKLSSGA